MIKKNRSYFIYNILSFLLFILVGFSCTSSPQYYTWDFIDEILSEIVSPVFPDKDFIITDFGAIGDGQFDCSHAFDSTMNACHRAGGGRVVVPAGHYLTGPIHLKSNVNLHVSKDAVLLFSTDIKDYLPVVLTRFEGVECMNYSPMIYAKDEENIAITGEGILDGQASNKTWWPWAKENHYGWEKGIPHQIEDRDVLFQMGEDNVPVENRVFGQGHYLRINFIQFYQCKNVLVEGVKIIRSPMWEIHPVLSENVIVRDVYIKTHGPNNDGCNPESCMNVLIDGCYFDTGDDCIAIKAGRNGDGRRVNVPSENIIIRNCQMKDGHGGVVIGSEMTGGVCNVFIEDCTMDSPHLDRALRIKTNSLRGGIVENVFMRNVEVGEVTDALIRIYFHYEKGDIGDFTPVVRNVIIENVTSKKSKRALILDGYERSPITNVHLKSCDFQGVEKANILNHVVGLKMEDVRINGQLQ